MLLELSMVDQRHRAVLEVLESDAKVIDVALRYGVDRRTIQRWVARYQQEGMGGLASRSTKPRQCPHQISPKLEERIVELRRADPERGARTIRNMLRKEFDEVPGYLLDSSLSCASQLSRP